MTSRPLAPPLESLEFVEMGLVGNRNKVLSVVSKLFPPPSELGEALRYQLLSIPENYQVTIKFDILI